MSIHFGGRTLARSQALQLLFQAEANDRAVIEVLDGDYALSEGPLDDYARQLALGADESRPDLDAIISMRATGWKLSRLNSVDRNLLRLALYEMLSVDEVDVPVTIDECVELAKAYGTDESSRTRPLARSPIASTTLLRRCATRTSRWSVRSTSLTRPSRWAQRP